MKKFLAIIMLLALAASLFSVSALAEAAPGDAPGAAEETAEKTGPDALDMFIYIAGGAVVVLALAMILIAYIKSRKG